LGSASEGERGRVAVTTAVRKQESKGTGSLSALAETEGEITTEREGEREREREGETQRAGWNERRRAALGTTSSSWRETERQRAGDGRETGRQITRERERANGRQRWVIWSGLLGRENGLGKGER